METLWLLHWFYPSPPAERRSSTAAPYVKGRAAFTTLTTATAAYEEHRSIAEARGGPAGAVTLERFEVRLLSRMELLAAALATASTLDDAIAATAEESRALYAPAGSWWSARQMVKNWRAKS